MRNVKLLIVDMDNTLCDTFHTLSKNQWEGAAKALRKEGWPDKASGLLKMFGKSSFVHTMKLLEFTAKQRAVAMRNYDNVPVSKLKLFDDAHALMDVPIPKVLVTRGEKALQVRKIAHLKIRKRFERIYYINTFDVKKGAFKSILKEFGVKPSEALVIGDRIEEEIKDANELGIPSVLVRRPDWPVHKGFGEPTMTVRSLKVLAKKLTNK